MPATAGRVRMPANNRVHSSAALQTHGIWQVAIGYDPYAPANKVPKPDSAAAENAYESFQGLLSLARITSAGGSETRGACKKCGRVGHLTYQCRNFLSLKDDRPPENDDSALRTASAVFERMKRAADGGKEESESEEEEDEISSSDSDVDPEIERIIAERFGKPLSKKAATMSKGSKKASNSSGGDEEEDERRKKRRHGHRKKRRIHRHRHRSSDSSDDGSDSDRHRKHKRRRRRRSESRDSNGGVRHNERRSVLSSDSESTASSSDEDERRRRRERRRSKGHRRGGKD